MSTKTKVITDSKGNPTKATISISNQNGSSTGTYKPQNGKWVVTKANYTSKKD